MGTMPIRPLVDRVLEGHLDETLCRYLDQGLSPSRMALRLASEHQVEVGSQTIKKWLADLSHGERQVADPRAQSAQTAPRRHAGAPGHIARTSAAAGPDAGATR